MIRRFAFALSLAVAALPALRADEISTQAVRSGYLTIEGAEALEHVKYLASDELEGRDTGSPGEWTAAQYIAKRFAEYGLEPVGTDGTYYQNYSIGSTAALGEKTRLSVKVGEETLAFEVEKEFTPFGFSANGALDGELVFAGYGISAPDKGYDDYAGLDVKGKIVLVLRHEPRQKDADSVFDGKNWSRHAWFATKVEVAQAHGAAGILIANDPLFGDDRGLGLQGAEGDYRIPSAYLTAAAAGRLFTQAGKDLLETQKAIDAEMKPVPVELGASASGEVELVKKSVPTRNVVGLLRGTDPKLADEYVVVGAHFDHVGWGSFGSRGDQRAIHNGADDNASGTSAVLELAQAFGTSGLKPRRSILFITFSGEERGLLGSAHYCANPIFPLEKTVAMINLDMVGRGDTGVFSANGVGTSPKFPAMLKTIEKAIHGSEGVELKIEYTESGIAPSDNTSFYEKNIPVLFFFTGIHPDYHMPSDDWDKINPANIELCAKMTYFAVVDLAILADERPAFVATGAGDMSQFGSGPRRRGPFLGIQPHYGDAPSETGGVHVQAVVKDSPAEKGGLKDGDTILEIGGKKVADLRAMSEILAEHEVGDEVAVKVLREGKELELKVTLGRRAGG